MKRQALGLSVTILAAVLGVLVSGCDDNDRPPTPELGTLVVLGIGNDTYSVEGWTTSHSTGTPVKLSPGTYTVVLNGIRKTGVVIRAHQETVVSTGILLVEGEGHGTYTVEGSNAERSTGDLIELFGGMYAVVLSGIRKTGVVVEPGAETVVSTGMLLVEGEGHDTYTVAGSNIGRPTGDRFELFGGTYAVVLNGIRKDGVVVEVGQETVLPTGMLLVEGEGHDSYTVAGSYVGRHTGDVFELFPDTYAVVLNGIRRDDVVVEVGQETVVPTGMLLVEGEGHDTYTVAGSHVGRHTGDVFELFPGTYAAVLNAVRRECVVAAAQQTVLSVGTLLVTTGEPVSYDLYDPSMRFLVRPPTNRDIELFPGEYVVALRYGGVEYEESVWIEAGEQTILAL